jgi:cell division protein FtsW
MSAPRRLNFDLPLFAVTVVLMTIGVVIVFSSSGFLAGERYSHPFHFMVQQLLGAAAGFALVVFLLSVKRSFFLNPYFIYGLLAVTVLLLMLALTMPAVARTNRWVLLFGVRFQPSELAKVSLILFLAAWIESRKDRLNEPKVLAVPLGVLFLTVLLVLMEPDFGTAVLLFVLAAMMLFVGGVKLRYFVAAGGLFAALFAFYLVQGDYRMDRIHGFLSPDKDPLGRSYQVTQSKLAVGSGGLLGVGLGQSTQKLYFLPSAHTDFIYAIWGEETGLVGTLAVLALYLLLLWRGLKISMAAPDPASRMVAAGVTLAVVVQALLNITVVLGLGPAKGIPLPLVSYGRSSLVCTLAAIGILLHISRKRSLGETKVRI